VFYFGRDPPEKGRVGLSVPAFFLMGEEKSPIKKKSSTSIPHAK